MQETYQKILKSRYSYRFKSSLEFSSSHRTRLHISAGLGSRLNLVSKFKRPFVNSCQIQILQKHRRQSGLLRFELSSFELSPFELSPFELGPGKLPLPVRPRPFLTREGKRLNLILRITPQRLNSEEIKQS